MAVPADRIVMTSAIVTLLSTTAESVLPESMGGQGELPHARLLLGTALAFTGLSFASDFAPGIAAPISIAIALTALTYYGFPLVENWLTGTHHTPGKVK